QRGISAPVTFLLTQTNYTTPTETFPFVFSNLIQGTSSSNTISIRPANGVQVSISGSGTPAIFHFNGSKHIRIIGSDTISNSGRKISIRNTTGDPCILLENDASFNEVRNSTLFGEPFLNSDGIVKFGNRLQNGNDNNIIDSCFIGAFSSSSRPSVCISANASTGPTLSLSSNNVITNNEIANPNNFGILIDNSNENYIITGNSFYKSFTYLHSGNFSFVGYYANGGLIANNTFGGSAANAGGTQYSMFDGTSGTFSLLSIQGFNIQVRKNSFRRIQFTGLFNNFSHSLIGVLNGKVILDDNTLGSDTGTNSIRLNYTNTVGSAGFSAINIGSGQGGALDSIQIINNKIGAIQAIGGGLLNLYGIRFNASSGNFITRGNLIGSNQSPGSISLACNGDLLGIEFTVNNGQNLLVENNTIRNLQYTLHHSRTVSGIFHSGNTPVIIRGNKIQQLYHIPANASLINPGFNFLNGIYMSATSSLTKQITNNQISMIHTQGAPSGGSMGIQVSGNDIEISRNRVVGVGPLSNTEARVRGIYSFGSNQKFFNNEISLGTDSLLTANTANISYQGLVKNGAANKVFFNTVRIAGANVVASGSNYSTAYLSEVGDIQDSVFNNIFINERSNVSAAGGKHYACYFWLGNNPIMNRNLLFVNGQNSFIGNVNATDYSSLGSFAIASNTNSNSRSKAIQFLSPWNLRLTGNSIGDTALAAMPISYLSTDKEMQLRDPFKPYMGCYEVFGSPLPVELLSFEALANELDVNLIWQTTFEQNNKGFYLERSTDNKLFEPITFVKSRGNSQVTSNYLFVDKRALYESPFWYYRLWQEDADGIKTNLGTRYISRANSQDESISIYPNPCREFVWIRHSESSTLEYIELYSTEGKLLKTWSDVNTNITNIELHGLNQGIYTLRIKTKEGVFAKKLSISN
ncbi:MAG: T9SS type A sorting domain-containing protein, partial [Bacteroidia bacterium]|nr:T9SS type A sorting domain-containing protein [Bacteroidia bacterium]